MGADPGRQSCRIVSLPRSAKTVFNLAMTPTSTSPICPNTSPNFKALVLSEIFSDPTTEQRGSRDSGDDGEQDSLGGVGQRPRLLELHLMRLQIAFPALHIGDITSVAQVPTETVGKIANSVGNRPTNECDANR
jgi:hypothetical protein